MAEYQQLSDGRPDGTLIGSAAADKVGFFGAIPVVQQAGAVAVATTAATSTSPFGFTEAQANAIIAGINALDTALTNLGLTA
jgi:hypothetical protein